MTTALSPSAAQPPVSAEPAPGSPEALLLLAGLGILPASADFNDPRFAPDTISSSLERLVAVKQELEFLAAEQKQLQEHLRLAHLRGDLRQQLPSRRYSLSCKEIECQLKARQAYEQQSGDATATVGSCFWELRSIKG
ncbi:hypothetical protein H8F24_16000 [Synechococcus sp. CBW1002]|nr:hypothetical protein H8F24_16000 [Synechococcus sp. CBW1002]QPN68666.1 hypothetical protein H8F26_16040 [Synechococcus sp. CBW1006]